MKPLLVASLLLGCGVVQGPAGPDFPTDNTEPRNGFELCRKISTTASHRAWTTAGAGWVFAIGAAGATAAGTTIIPLSADNLSRAEKITASSLTAGGIILALIARGWFKRSDAASKLAGETEAVLGSITDPVDTSIPQSPTSLAVASKCNTALAAWDAARTDATAVANALLEQKKTEQAKTEKTNKAQALELLQKTLDEACPDPKADCNDSLKKLRSLLKAVQ